MTDIVNFWQLDRDLTLRASHGAAGHDVRLNDEKLALRWSRNIAFTKLRDGRSVQLIFVPGLGARSRFEVRVDQRLVQPNVVSLVCRACKAEWPPADARCGQCGAAMSDGRDERTLRRATRTLFGLGAMFALGGVLLYAVGLATPGGAHPDGLPFFDLINNLILAVAMVALGFWSRRAPLPALMTGVGIYLVVYVSNALFDPSMLARAGYTTLVFVLFMSRAIEAALRQQTA